MRYRVRRRGKNCTYVLQDNFKSLTDVWEFITKVGKGRQSFSVDVWNGTTWTVHSVLCAREAERRLR